MPKIKIAHIISFSSEDSIYVANNLLSSDNSKQKWLCRTPGEKTAVVVLQLEKATEISSIDIGNEHSAYIEILASRSGSEDDFKVLLVTSSFMTPLESRQSKNINKVRMFAKEQLSEPLRKEKWDRIKIICTQPFNKHVQYGLSFVNLHTSEAKNNFENTSPHVGKFLLRPESPNNISIGSIFAKDKQSKREDKLTGAAAIREAASATFLATFGSPVCKAKQFPHVNLAKRKKLETPDSPKPRNRDELLYTKDEEEHHEKIDKVISKNTKDVKEKHVENKNITPNNINKQKNSANSFSPNTIDKTNEKYGKRKLFEVEQKLDKSKDKLKIPKKKTIGKLFNKLLEGVVLVISGIQNPDRANLREKALSMGAKYKSDWNNSCTHLICAFRNTPKFNQVKGKGKIVKKQWIEDCHQQRKKLPWRRYALDKNDKERPESEDEVCKKIEIQASESDIMDFNEDNEQEREEHSDTEERLELIKRKKIDHNTNKTADAGYDSDTDKEEIVKPTITAEKHIFKSFFSNKVFFIDNCFDKELSKQIRKYIIAYNGKCAENPEHKIDFIISTQSNRSDIKQINSAAEFVSPDWIWECHNVQKLVPIDDYQL